MPPGRFARISAVVGLLLASAFVGSAEATPFDQHDPGSQGSLCLLQQLRVQYQEAQETEWLPHRPPQYSTAFSVTLINTSPLPCVLVGTPKLRIYSTTGSPVPAFDDKAKNVPDRGEHLLLPGSYGETPAVWHSSWCGKRSGFRVRVDLALQSLTTGPVTPPPCQRGVPTGRYYNWRWFNQPVL